MPFWRSTQFERRARPSESFRKRRTVRQILFLHLSPNRNEGNLEERDGISAYTREDIAHLIEQRFGKHYHPASLHKVLRRMGFSHQKARPVHPQADLKAQAAWKKGGCPAH
jgi:transposase